MNSTVPERSVDSLRFGEIFRFRVCFSFCTKSMRGSALTEFFFLTIIMIPLFFGIPMIGKLIDLKQTAVQAGRYATWEATVYSDSGAPMGESAVDNPHATQPGHVQDRFFGGQDAVISSASSDAGQNSLWGDSVVTRGPREASAIRLDEASLSIRTSDLNYSGVGNSIGFAVNAAANALGTFSDGEWDLEKNGMIKRTVSLEIKANDWVFDTVSACGTGAGYGCIEESGVILTDGWSSGHDDQAAKRVKSLVPASGLHKVGEYVSVLGKVPLFEELKKLDDAFGYVDMQALPVTATLPKWKEGER